MLRNCNRTSSFGLQGLFTWAQIKNIAYVILPFFGLLETLFYITTKICANSMLYRLFSRIMDKIPFNEIAFFNAIYFWKKYFKDLLKIFLIELKEKLYYNYLKGIILYPGLCSIFLVIALIFFCDNSTAYAYDLPEIWAVENLENDFKTYCTSNPQRFQDAYNDYLTRKRARGPFSKLLTEGNSKRILNYTYNSTLKVITNDDFYKALLENKPKIRRHSTIEVLVDLNMQMNQSFLESAGLDLDSRLGDNYLLNMIHNTSMKLCIELNKEITTNDEEIFKFYSRML